MNASRRALARTLLLCLATALPLKAADASGRTKPAKIAVVFWSTPLDARNEPGAGNPAAAALRKGLSSLGWVEGTEFEIVWASALGDMRRMGGILDGFVARGVDLIVVTGNIGAAEARKRTRRIPVVMSYSQSPVKIGLVASLARPGGNVTGLVGFEDAELYVKRLSLLKEMDPRVTRVAFMTSFDSINGWDYAKGALEMARMLGISLFPVRLDSPQDLEGAFAEALRQGANGVFMDSVLSTREQHQAVIGALARRHRIPIVYTFQAAAQYGGLLVYDEDRHAAWVRVAHFVDRILRGADPAGLPLEQAGLMRLVINTRAARDIGLSIPKSLLRQADEVID